MKKIKLKLGDICVSKKTIGNVTYCNIFNKTNVVDKYEELPIIMNELHNVNILNINIQDINTLHNFDKKLDNLPCLLIKIIFRLHLKMFYDDFSFKNFNFIHKLKIPHNCNIYFKLDNSTFTITNLLRYEYLVIKSNSCNGEIMVKYTNQFCFQLQKSIPHVYGGLMQLVGIMELVEKKPKTKIYYNDAISLKNINKIYKNNNKMRNNFCKGRR